MRWTHGWGWRSAGSLGSKLSGSKLSGSRLPEPGLPEPKRPAGMLVAGVLAAGVLAAGGLTGCAAGTIDAGEAPEGAGGAGGMSGVGGMPAPAIPLDCSGPPAQTAVGYCDGAQFYFCDSIELRFIDCGRVGASCGFRPEIGQFDCVVPNVPGGDPETLPDPPGEPDPMPGEPEAQPMEPDPPADMPCINDPDGSVCVGDTVIICRGGEPGGRTDCAMNGLTCGPAPSGGMGCVAGGESPPEGGGPEPDPMPPNPGGDGVCAGRDGGARCDGDVVVQCRGGQEDSRFDCTANGQTCATFGNTWAGCEGENMNPDVPEPEPPGERCGPQHLAGLCEGNVLVGCNLFEFEVFRLDCGWLFAMCTVVDGVGGCR